MESAQFEIRHRNCVKAPAVEEGALEEGTIDPVGGGTVKLTADHVNPHSLNPKTDRTDPTQWQALCGRHQVMKKNYWDSASRKLNILGILQNVNKAQKVEALKFLLLYFGMTETKIGRGSDDKS